MAEELSSEAMLEAVNKDHQASQGQETKTTPTEAPQEQTQTKIDPQTGQKYKYVTSGGREVEEPLDMVLKRAGMGYHYAQQMHQLNLNMDAWSKEKNSIQERIKGLERWETYDKYGRDNPEWLKHWEGAWDNRLAGGVNTDANTNPYATKFKEYDETISNLRKFMDESVQERQKAQEAQEDTAFVKEIEKVAKDFDIDFHQADLEGRSLEMQVIEHMKALNLTGRPGQFTAAFKDFYFNNLQGKAKEKALENTSKEKAELKKAGIIDISRSPKGPNPSKGFRKGMGYQDAESAILAELSAKS